MQQLTPFDISKDAWIVICGCLTPLDFLSLRQTCSFLCDTTNNRKHVSINKYWQKQCESFWSQIKKSHYKTENWFCLFQSMIDIIILCDLRSILKKHEKTIEQLQSTDSIIFRNNAHDNNIRYNKQNLEQLDAKLRLIYGMKITINTILDSAEDETSEILINIIRGDKVELFKIYIYNTNVNEIIVYSPRTKHEKSVIITAIEASSFKILEYLLGDADDDDNDDNYSFKESIDVNEEYSVMSPLSMAARYKQANVVSLLIKHPNMTKKGINASTAAGRTALHYACFLSGIHDQTVAQRKKTIENSVEIIKLLVSDKRTDVNIPDNIGYTPLMVAVRNHSKLVEALLSNKENQVDANVVCTDENDFTAMHVIAARWGIFKDKDRIKSAKILLAKCDVDCNILNRYGKTALQVAKDYKFDALVNVLSQYTSPLNIKSTQQNS